MGTNPPQSFLVWYRRQPSKETMTPENTETTIERLSPENYGTISFPN
jgi:hypothetical protein